MNKFEFPSWALGKKLNKQERSEMNTLFSEWWKENTSEKFGDCWCGCKEETKLSKKNHHWHGFVKDQPKAYVNGHSNRRGDIRCLGDIYAPLKLNEFDLGWVCGFWEGEGYIRVQMRKQDEYKKVEFSTCSTDEDNVDNFNDKLGIFNMKKYSQQQKGNRKRIFSGETNTRNEVLHIAYNLYSYLSLQRKGQCKEVLDFFDIDLPENRIPSDEFKRGWIIGILEAEGSFYSYFSYPGNGRNDYLRFGMACCSTSLCTIQRYVDWFSETNIRVENRDSKGWKTGYYSNIGEKQRIQNFIEDNIHLFSARRQERMSSVLEQIKASPIRRDHIS